jgi:hypothetical protein
LNKWRHKQQCSFQSELAPSDCRVFGTFAAATEGVVISGVHSCTLHRPSLKYDLSGVKGI